MATDIGYLNRMIDQFKKKSGDDGNKSAGTLVTRDLLGGCAAADSTTGVLDLRSQDPSAWEIHIDRLKLEKGYISRNNSPGSQYCNQNSPPKKQLLNLLEESKLDLKNFPSTYQSTCTLDKVKFALERVEKETSKKRLMSWRKPASTNSNSQRFEKEDEEEDYTKTPSSFAAGCPSCMMYVLISKNNPKCPRCQATIDCPVNLTMKKKHCIDLNMSI
ncbi:uncharacterized protein LOC124940499 [Impatiens glandulifera]|uniref:uncharacterized protein LOC124940499 n=1 Tax=Impatiens glandulifera TaxID=253017 RepID=UPI001FB0D8B4|nr:uncharacterized protein LOC124940499 [Impatiens glandulifera]